MFNESLSKEIFNDSVFKTAAMILIFGSAFALFLWLIHGTVSLSGARAVCATIIVLTFVSELVLFLKSKN